MAAASESSPEPEIECPLAAAHAAEIEPDGGAAESVEHMEKIVDQRVVHCPAELRMRMQNQRHGRTGGLLPLIARLDAPGRSRKDDIRHALICSQAQAGSARFV